MERHDDDDMLHPDTREVLTRINAENERKVMQRVYSAEDPSAREPLLSPATRFLIFVLFVAALGWGGHMLWQKYGASTEVAQPEEPAAQPLRIEPPPAIEPIVDDPAEPALPPPAPPVTPALGEIPPPPAGLTPAKIDVDSLQPKVKTLQKQLDEALGKRDELEKQLGQIVNSDKKTASKRAGLVSMVVSAHDALVRADSARAAAKAAQVALKKQYEVATEHRKLVLNPRIARATQQATRSTAEVEKAEDALCEKLTALDALIGTKRRWRREELGSRRDLELKITAMKDEARVAKRELSPEAARLAKLLVEQETAIGALQGKSEEAQAQLEESIPQPE